jgi:FkbM family methyltransferase
MRHPFKFHQPDLGFLGNLWRGKRLQQLIKARPNLFLPAGDIVSIEPLIFGTYEQGVRKLFEHFSEQGYSDALFDIGANIGLSTVFGGENFEQVFCFEPNPILFDVLCANTRTLPYKTTLFDFGLGPEDRLSILRVPHHNVGGGYVISGNTYSAAELLKKDFINQGGGNDSYSEMSVQIKNCRVVLEGILSNLAPNSKLLFKIDVEGYEKEVLVGISQALRPEHQAVIIFENFSDKITPAFLHSIFANLKSIERLTTNLDQLDSKLHKLVRMMVSGRIFSLETEPARLQGEVVLMIG